MKAANFRNLYGTLFRILLLVVFLTGFGTASEVQAWQVTLKWDQNDPTPDGYRVYMRQEGEDFDYSAPKWQGETTTCTITGNSDSADYYFVVRAFAADDESGDSNEIEYTPPTTDETVDAGAEQTVDPDLDSDDDGITDVDETDIYITDPTNADSDGDGYLDGQEAIWGTDPNDADSNPDSLPQVVSIWIEAEDGDIYSPMVISDNAQASNASCIEVPDGNKNYRYLSSAAGSAIYTFEVPEGGSYVIWSRIIANDNRSNSIFVSVDGEPYMVWNTIQSEKDTWTWDVITKRRFWKTSDTENPEVYQFDAGTHTIEFVQRESGLMLDGILITKDLALTPGS